MNPEAEEALRALSTRSEGAPYGTRDRIRIDDQAALSSSRPSGEAEPILKDKRLSDPIIMTITT